MRYFSNTYYPYTQLVPTDIYPVQYGAEQCEQDHSFGPCIRSNYLIHYVYSGKGYFKTEHQEYELQKGQLFLISPNQLTYYKADSDKPWLYRWIEFNGSLSLSILKSSGLSKASPILTDDAASDMGAALTDIVSSGDIPYEILMQKVWAFIFSLTKGRTNISVSRTEEYVQKAESFIKINVHKKITVNDIASYIGIDRSYLCRLFQEYKNISPQQFITALKMNTAAQYLKNPNLTISEIAQSVGYADPHIFTKTFKKQFCICPTQWRQKLQWEQSIIQLKK